MCLSRLARTCFCWKDILITTFRGVEAKFRHRNGALDICELRKLDVACMALIIPLRSLLSTLSASSF